MQPPHPFLPPPQAPWPPPVPFGPPPAPPRPPQKETKAAASLALGVLSVAGAICGVGLTLGLPAIVLGALAHRDIRRSGGTAGGGGLATAGILLGSFGTLLFGLWVAVVAVAFFQPGQAARAFSPTPPDSPVSAPATLPAAASPVVELHTSGGALRAQLASQASSAQRAGESVLVETSTASCDPCSEIAQAMPDPSVGTALAKVRLLRIDVGEFRSELAGLRMNEPTVPWFYLLDSRGQPRDAISADEWDDNVAENIAPVLGAFVHGKLQPRRTSWRGRTSL